MNFGLLAPEIAMAILVLTLVVVDLFISDKTKSALAYLTIAVVAIGIMQWLIIIWAA